MATCKKPRRNPTVSAAGTAYVHSWLENHNVRISFSSPPWRELNTNRHQAVQSAAKLTTLPIRSTCDRCTQSTAGSTPRNSIDLHRQRRQCQAVNDITTANDQPGLCRSPKQKPRKSLQEPNPACAQHKSQLLFATTSRPLRTSSLHRSAHSHRFLHCFKTQDLAIHGDENLASRQHGEDQLQMPMPRSDFQQHVWVHGCEGKQL